VFRRWTKVLRGWNNMRVSNYWQKFHFGVNYPFKMLICKFRQLLIFWNTAPLEKKRYRKGHDVVCSVLTGAVNFVSLLCSKSELMREGWCSIASMWRFQRHLFPPPMSTRTLHTFMMLTFHPSHQPSTLPVTGHL